MQEMMFYLFSGVVLASAMLAVIAKRAVHSVLALVASFFGSAWVFFMLNAEFLAFLLIVIYVGAIAVLFLFCAMMLETSAVENTQKPIGKVFAAVCGVLIFLEIMMSGLSFVTEGTWSVPYTFQMLNIAETLYFEYITEFQMLGIILLIAMVGAIILTADDSVPTTKRQVVNTQVLRTREESIDVVKVKTGEGVKL